MRRTLGLLGAAAVLAFSAGCGRGAAAKEDAGEPKASETPVAVAIPVRIAAVERATLADEVVAPGKTAALVQEKVRAPFPGTLTELSVVDGDRVRRGQTVGFVVSRDSEAALAGAREMERQASTDAEKSDAARAVALAEKGLVRAPLTSPGDGTVLAHAAARGDRVTEDQEILTIADVGSVAFLADVNQSDLARIRPGQSASVEISGHSGRVAGTVHDVLPAASAADFTAPVRIDLSGLDGVPPLGLFGTAHIAVANARDAAAVPETAILRDDVHGTSRIAVVENGHAHWIDVATGLRSRGLVQITKPALAPGTAVVVSGQVGLPEGAAVAPAK